MVIVGLATTLADAGYESLVEVLRPLFLKANVVVGGVFGLYLILVLVRIYYERKKVKLLEDIKYNLDRANISKGLPYSRTRKTPFKRFMLWIKSKFAHNLFEPIKKKKKKQK
jgi:hypothetical protein